MDEMYIRLASRVARLEAILAKNYQYLNECPELQQLWRDYLTDQWGPASALELTQERPRRRHFWNKGA
ncbi:MAG TPA: hypothetical protein VKT82_00820 [Ktedonobacterales bacterium]|nr:hypothetical protein [Ktedonobacterales bacterium]